PVRILALPTLTTASVYCGMTRRWPTSMVVLWSPFRTMMLSTRVLYCRAILYRESPGCTVYVMTFWICTGMNSLWPGTSTSPSAILFAVINWRDEMPNLCAIENIESPDWTVYHIKLTLFIIDSALYSLPHHMVKPVN